MHCLLSLRCVCNVISDTVILLVSMHLTLLGHAIADHFFLSVHLFVTFHCFVQTNEHMIMRFSASRRTILLVSGEVKFIRIFAGRGLVSINN